MRQYRVSILTGWGDRLGAGHIQRMASLVMFLNRIKEVPACIVCDRAPDLAPPIPSLYFQTELNSGNCCVIRDMRDSSIDEMRKLKAVAKVIAIDDCGPGRDLADARVNLLPHPSLKKYNRESFIFGYNFTESVRSLAQKQITKDIDAVLYCGVNPDPETIGFFRSLVPNDKTCAILCEKDPRMIAGGKESPLTRSYAETMLSARVLISHFGISLYEGRLSGCRLACINPTEYHSRLADIAGGDIGIENLGVRASLDRAYARERIEYLIRNPLVDRIYPPELIQKIDAALENFYSEIKQYLF
jgi:hypothetical protein